MQTHLWGVRPCTGGSSCTLRSPEPKGRSPAQSLVLWPLPPGSYILIWGPRVLGLRGQQERVKGHLRQGEPAHSGQLTPRSCSWWLSWECVRQCLMRSDCCCWLHIYLSDAPWQATAKVTVTAEAVNVCHRGFPHCLPLLSRLLPSETSIFIWSNEARQTNQVSFFPSLGFLVKR